MMLLCPKCTHEVFVTEADYDQPLICPSCRREIMFRRPPETEAEARPEVESRTRSRREITFRRPPETDTEARPEVESRTRSRRYLLAIAGILLLAAGPVCALFAWRLEHTRYTSVSASGHLRIIYDDDEYEEFLAVLARLPEVGFTQPEVRRAIKGGYAKLRRRRLAKKLLWASAVLGPLLGGTCLVAFWRLRLREGGVPSR